MFSGSEKYFIYTIILLSIFFSAYVCISKSTYISAHIYFWSEILRDSSTPWKELVFTHMALPLVFSKEERKCLNNVHQANNKVIK